MTMFEKVRDFVEEVGPCAEQYVRLYQLCRKVGKCDLSTGTGEDGTVLVLDDGNLSFETFAEAAEEFSRASRPSWP